ncbi:MAG: hypothetical protein IKX89_04560 [Firmicutes bacterium]|nr:hypothetical protein [Bacillota bacterium]
MKNNNAISGKVKVLALVLILVILGMVYYYFVYTSFQQQKASYDTTPLEEQMTVELAKAQTIKKMQEEIAKGGSGLNGVVAVYDNQSTEIQAINDIFGENATNIMIDWKTPELTGQIVRRNAAIKFTTDSYVNARQIIDQLAGCDYRLVINDVNINSGNRDASFESTEEISVSVSVTFFETTFGAESTKGLIVVDKANK